MVAFPLVPGDGRRYRFSIAGTIWSLNFMDETKNALLMRFAAHAGVAEAIVEGCRDAKSRGEPIARYLRDLVNRQVLTCTQTRHLLIAAFDFSIGHVQLVQMWCEGFVNDKELEDHLFSSVDDFENTSTHSPPSIIKPDGPTDGQETR